VSKVVLKLSQKLEVEVDMAK